MSFIKWKIYREKKIELVLKGIIKKEVLYDVFQIYFIQFEEIECYWEHV